MHAYECGPLVTSRALAPLNVVYMFTSAAIWSGVRSACSVFVRSGPDRDTIVVLQCIPAATALCIFKNRGPAAPATQHVLLERPAEPAKLSVLLYGSAGQT